MYPSQAVILCPHSLVPWSWKNTFEILKKIWNLERMGQKLCLLACQAETKEARHANFFTNIVAHAQATTGLTGVN